jgi:CBS domain-containing protein
VRDWTILNEPVEKHASKDFIIIEEGASVRDAAIQMRSRGHTCVLVARGGKPVGIVTERDVLYRVVASGRDPNKVMLKEVMSSPLITVNPKTSLSEAMTLMATRGVGGL